MLVFPHQTVGLWQYSDGTYSPPLTVAPNTGGGVKNFEFRPTSRFISEMI